MNDCQAKNTFGNLLKSIYCTIKAKYIVEDEMCDAYEDAHSCFFARKPAKKNTEGIFIYKPQTLPLRQILKPQLF